MNHILKTVVLAAGLACSAFAAQAQNQPITIKVHHFLGPQTVQHTTMLADWCKSIEKDSKGRLQCQIFPAMQLGGTPPQLVDQARDGVADVVWTAAGLHRRPLLRARGVRAALHAAPTPKPPARAAWDYTQKYGLDDFKDVKLLAIHVHGAGVIIHQRASRSSSLEDLKGLKLRSPTATWPACWRAGRDPGRHAGAAGARGAVQGRDRRRGGALRGAPAA